MITYNYDQYASIIVLSLMSNLLFVGKTIAYKIQVLSLILLMKMIWSKDVTIAPRENVELWYEKKDKN